MTTTTARTRERNNNHNEKNKKTHVKRDGDDVGDEQEVGARSDDEVIHPEASGVGDVDVVPLRTPDPRFRQTGARQTDEDFTRYEARSVSQPATFGPHGVSVVDPTRKK